MIKIDHAQKILVCDNNVIEVKIKIFITNLNKFVIKEIK